MLKTGKHSFKRDKYWTSHGNRPTVDRQKYSGMTRRLMQNSLLTEIVQLASFKGSQEVGFRQDILNQKLNGALKRLKDVNPFSLVIPPKIESARLASAMKSTQGERGR